MTGQRLPDGYPWWSSEKDPNPTPPGSYWRDDDGTWTVCTPNGRFGNIGKHTVVEHEDRTITVSPSILIYPRDAAPRSAEELASMQQKYGWNEEETASALDGRPGWHGFLDRGIWRDCR